VYMKEKVADLLASTRSVLQYTVRAGAAVLVLQCWCCSAGAAVLVLQCWCSGVTRCCVASRQHIGGSDGGIYAHPTITQTHGS
jgi:hypothetical protein